MEEQQTIKMYKNEEISMADSSNIERYIIIEESISAHCCFGYSIVDTTEGFEICEDSWRRRMCETFEIKEAIEICDALNKYYK
jgi:hypothetical protein